MTSRLQTWITWSRREAEVASSAVGQSSRLPAHTPHLTGSNRPTCDGHAARRGRAVSLARSMAAADRVGASGYTRV